MEGELENNMGYVEPQSVGFGLYGINTMFSLPFSLEGLAVSS